MATTDIRTLPDLPNDRKWQAPRPETDSTGHAVRPDMPPAADEPRVPRDGE